MTPEEAAARIAELEAGLRWIADGHSTVLNNDVEINVPHPAHIAQRRARALLEKAP